MKTPFRRIVIRLLAAALLALSLQAGDLSGRVTRGPNPVAGAVVRVRDIKTNRVSVTETNSRGQYLIRNLREGSHVLEIRQAGRIVCQRQVTIGNQQTQENVNVR